jgi:FkbM family methyltransferase
MLQFAAVERGDEGVIRAFAARLAELGDDEAGELLAALIDRLHVETVGSLMEKLPPLHSLDYAARPIQLLVSSSEIGVRLRSVEKEPFTVEWIEQSLRPGEVFYDIGANVGAYSLIAAKATGNGARIYAFEPSPSSFLDLFRNAVLNGCAESIVALPFALWTDNELLSLSSAPPVAGSAGHLISRRDDEPDASAVVGIRLDDLVERFGLPVPTHAKIDTDGYELRVLQGAERTLARPEWKSIIIELDRVETSRNREIRETLAAAGFDASREHPRVASPGFPHPEGRPDVYWTFSRSSPVPPSGPRTRAKTVQAAQRRAVAATLAVISILFLLLVFLPEQLGDRPYDVFGLNF